MGYDPVSLTVNPFYHSNLDEWNQDPAMAKRLEEATAAGQQAAIASGKKRGLDTSGAEKQIQEEKQGFPKPMPQQQVAPQGTQDEAPTITANPSQSQIADARRQFSRAGGYGNPGAAFASDPYANNYRGRSFMPGQEASYARVAASEGDAALKADKQILSEMFKETQGKSNDRWWMNGSFSDGEMMNALARRTGIEPGRGQDFRSYMSHPTVQAYVQEIKSNPELAKSSFETPQSAKEKAEMDEIKRTGSQTMQVWNPDTKTYDTKLNTQGWGRDGVTNSVNLRRIENYRAANGKDPISMEEVSRFDGGLQKFETDRVARQYPKFVAPEKKLDPLQRADSGIAKDDYNKNWVKYSENGEEKSFNVNTGGILTKATSFSGSLPGYTGEERQAIDKYQGVMTNAPAKTPDELKQRALAWSGKMKSSSGAELVGKKQETKPEPKPVDKNKNKDYYANKGKPGYPS